MLFHGWWKFEGCCGIFGRAVGDWHDEHLFAIFVCVECKYDGARTVLAAIFAAGTMFAQPKIGVSDDEAWFGLRKTHGVQSLTSLSRWR